jgi:5-oxoprolinase (ATP-hydrolysing)
LKLIQRGPSQGEAKRSDPEIGPPDLGIGGDLGGGSGHDHAAGLQDIEPSRFPVVLEAFSIRRGSGGRGRHRAGDGTRRVIRFLEPMECALLSGHRRVPPFGVDGGAPGEIGRNLVRRRDGGLEDLGGCASTLLEAGEAVIIVTPTGGGFGRDPQA